MLRVHLFSFFTIKTPGGFVALVTFGILISLRNRQLYSNYYIYYTVSAIYILT